MVDGSRLTSSKNKVANRDIYQRIINPNADAKKSLKMSKVIMLLIGIVTFVLCQFPGGPTYLFAFGLSLQKKVLIL